MENKIGPILQTSPLQSKNISDSAIVNSSNSIKSTETNDNLKLQQSENKKNTIVESSNDNKKINNILSTIILGNMNLYSNHKKSSDVHDKNIKSFLESLRKPPNKSISYEKHVFKKEKKPEITFHFFDIKDIEDSLLVLERGNRIKYCNYATSKFDKHKDMEDLTYIFNKQSLPTDKSISHIRNMRKNEMAEQLNNYINKTSRRRCHLKKVCFKYDEESNSLIWEAPENTTYSGGWKGLLCRFQDTEASLKNIFNKDGQVKIYTSSEKKCFNQIEEKVLKVMIHLSDIGIKDMPKIPVPTQGCFR